METKKQDKNAEKQKKTRRSIEPFRDPDELPSFYGSVSRETVDSVCRGCPFKGQCNTCLDD